MASLMSQPAGNRAPGYCSNVTLLSFCSMWPLCTLLLSAGIQMHTHPLPAEVQISALHLYSCREKKKKQLWHQREDFTEQSWFTCWVKAQRRKKRKKKKLQRCFPGALPVMMFVGQKNRRVCATACCFLGRCSSQKCTKATRVHIVQDSNNTVPKVSFFPDLD